MFLSYIWQTHIVFIMSAWVLPSNFTLCACLEEACFVRWAPDTIAAEVSRNAATDSLSDTLQVVVLIIDSQKMVGRKL